MKQLTKTIACEYSYDTELEREEHVKYMESQGFECTGQVRRSDDPIMKNDRKYYWYAKFYKIA